MGCERESLSVPNVVWKIIFVSVSVYTEYKEVHLDNAPIGFSSRSICDILGLTAVRSKRVRHVRTTRCDMHTKKKRGTRGVVDRLVAMPMFYRPMRCQI